MAYKTTQSRTSVGIVPSYQWQWSFTLFIKLEGSLTLRRPECGKLVVNNAGGCSAPPRSTSVTPSAGSWEGKSAKLRHGTAQNMYKG